MTLEIRSNGQIFIAGTKGEQTANSPFEARGLLKEAGFWWHGGPCKPGCVACSFKVPKMWWTADPAKAARLKQFCNEKALLAIAPVLTLKAKSMAVTSDLAVPKPEGLSYDPFQVAGIEFCLNAYKTYKGALIADEMGLGKTVQALGLMNMLELEDLKAFEESDFTHKRHYLTCAVICPKSLVLNWEREAQKWLGKDWQVWTHEEWLRGGCALSMNQLIIFPYSQVNKFPRTHFDEPLELDLLVFDEAHYIKNPEAQRTQECIPAFVKGKRAEGSGRIAEQAAKLLFLTGTPILNRPVELQTLLCAIDPTFSGFWFLKRFCDAKKDAHGTWDFSGHSHLEELQDTLRTKFMVRRLKKDVYKDLPPKRHSLIPIPLSNEAKAVLKRAGPEEPFEDAVNKMESKKPWGHPSQVRVELALTKVGLVVDFVKDLLQNTEKVIVFGWSVDALKQIAQELRLVVPKVGLIIGDTDSEAREAYVRSFQEDPECRVIVGGYGPMGVGLTLTAAQTVVLAEPAWTPGEVNQAIDRAHRRGQQGMVNAYYLMYEGTLEAKMMQMVIRKQEVADKALDRDTEIVIPESQRDEIERQVVASRRVVADSQGHLLRGSVTTKQLEDKFSEAIAAINEGEDEYRVNVLGQNPVRMFTPEEKALIHRGLKFLASVCDGAKDQDGAGFNGLDSAFGKSLAAASSLSDKQAHHGKKLVIKYQKQLQNAGISIDSLKGV